MKHTFFIVFLVAGSLIARGQQANTPETHRFTLQQSIDYAYEHNDSLKNAQLDIEIANARVKEVFGMGLPQVSGSASLQDALKLPTSLLPGEFFGQPAGTFIPVKFGVKYQSALGLNIDQLVFDGTYLVGLKASKTYKELSSKAYNRSKIATNVAVTKAFYQVLVSAEQLKLLDANIAQLNQLLKETTELFNQGFAEKIDSDKLKVQLNNLTTSRENVVRMLALGYQLLKYQMGMPVNENLTLIGSIQEIQLDPTASVPSSDSTSYQNRIEYSLLQTQRDLNLLDLKRYKSQYLPSVSAFASTNASYQNNRFGDLYSQNFPNTYIGLRVSVPIFSGFQRLNRVRQAQFNVTKSNNVLNNVKNAIALEIDNARTQYVNSIASLNSQKENMELAREILRVSKIKYEQGVGSSIEVTQAQTSVEQAENNYIQALYSTLVSKVDLEKASGKITY